MRGGTQYNTYSFVMQLVQMRLICAVELRVQCKLPWQQTKVEHSTIFCYANCTDEGWNTAQYSFVMQIVQMRIICAVELKVQG